MLRALFSILFSLHLTAEPLLTKEQRENLSSDIVEGLVTGLIRIDIAYPGGMIEDVYFAQLEIQSVNKGSESVGDTVYFSFWKLREDTRQGQGPSGQIDVVKNETRIKAYLVKEKGEFRLLDPNGFDNL